MEPQPTTLASTQVKARLGDRRLWARDLALIGALSSFTAPLIAVPMIGWDYPIVASIAGALTGAALGWFAPGMLAKFRRWPLSILLLVGGPIVGALWGATVGASAIPMAISELPEAWWISPLVAGTAGALQLGWFWLPYTWLQARSKARWPLVVVAGCFGAPLGYLSVLASIFGIGFFMAL